HCPPQPENQPGGFRRVDFEVNYSLQGLLLVATPAYCDSTALPPTTRTGKARYKHKLCPVRPTESHNARGPSAEKRCTDYVLGAVETSLLMWHLATLK